MKHRKAVSRVINVRILIYLFFTIFIILLLFDYVRPNPNEYVSYLSYCIYILGLVGLFLFFKAYARIVLEQNCAELVHNKANSILIKIKANGLDYHLGEFKELGTKDENLAVNRIIAHIHTEAESKKFDSGLAILSNYKEEIVNVNTRLFGFQKVGLQLGILGTFIGLAMAFKDLEGTSIDEHAIDHLLKSLKIPFSTSIAGLQVAFILWLFLDFLHKRQENLFIIFEKCLDEVINLARHAIYKDSITIELQHVSSRMDDISARIEKGNELLYSQSNQIAEGIGKLKSANSDLDMFLYGITSKQQAFSDTVKSLYDSLSPSQISHELKSSLSNGAIEITKGMSAQLEDTLRKYSEVQISMGEMATNFKNMTVSQNQYFEQLSKTDMRQQIKEVLNSAATNVTRELQNNFEGLEVQLATLIKELSEYNNNVKKGKQKWNWLLKWFRRPNSKVNTY